MQLAPNTGLHFRTPCKAESRNNISLIWAASGLHANWSDIIFPKGSWQLYFQQMCPISESRSTAWTLVPSCTLHSMALLTNRDTRHFAATVIVACTFYCQHLLCSHRVLLPLYLQQLKGCVVCEMFLCCSLSCDTRDLLPEQKAVLFVRSSEALKCSLFKPTLRKSEAYFWHSKCVNHTSITVCSYETAMVHSVALFYIRHCVWRSVFVAFQ